MEIEFSKVDELERTPARFPKWLIWLLLLSPVIIPIMLVISIMLDIDALFLMLLFVLMFSPILLAVGMLLLRVGVGYPNRVVRSYLGHDNEYDLTTPRKYTALASNWLMERRAGDSRYLLDSFIYTDHNIRITTKNGQVLTAALDEVLFSCELENRWHRGEMFRFDVIKDNRKEVVCFYYIKGMFMKEEWTDMLNILLRAKTKYNFSDAEFFKRFSRLVKIEANMQLLGNFHK